VISRWIDWCAQNRFLVFMGTVLLVLTGIWALRHIPLDALPDISDVEVIIHTPWAGQPPSLIEDQVTYPNRHYASRRTARKGGAGTNHVWGFLRLCCL
jgi:Cu(I)/Ag(I) efflux system membrane protein CusA/SilA